MWKKLLLLGALGLISAALPGTPASAQASRTWVSGVGDDANPCSRTAPCKTFAGAISKTAAGGEISVLDPGGYGAVTITKAITLDGGGGIVGSILVSGTNGVNVSAGANDIVQLRNLRIVGGPSGVNGITYNSGAELSVHNVVISNFSGFAINANTNGASELYVTDTYITNVGSGIGLATTAASPNQLTAVIAKTRILNTTAAAGSGVVSSGTGSVDATISNSIITSSNTGVTVGAGHDFQIDNSTILLNNTGVSAGNNSAVRMTRNLLAGNAPNFAIGSGASIASDGRNRVAPANLPGPNGTVTMQ